MIEGDSVMSTECLSWFPFSSFSNNDSESDEVIFY